MTRVDLNNLDLDGILDDLCDAKADQLKTIAETDSFKTALKNFHTSSDQHHTALSDQAENLYHKINHHLATHADDDPSFFKQETKTELDLLSNHLKNLLKKVDNGLFISWNSKDPNLIDHYNDLKMKIKHTLFHFIGHPNNDKAATGMYQLLEHKNNSSN